MVVVVVVFGSQSDLSSKADEEMNSEQFLFLLAYYYNFWPLVYHLLLKSHRIVELYRTGPRFRPAIYIYTTNTIHEM